MKGPLFRLVQALDHDRSRGGVAAWVLFLTWPDLFFKFSKKNSQNSEIFDIFQQNILLDNVEGICNISKLLVKRVSKRRKS